MPYQIFEKPTDQHGLFPAIIPRPVFIKVRAPKVRNGTADDFLTPDASGIRNL